MCQKMYQKIIWKVTNPDVSSLAFETAFSRLFVSAALHDWTLEKTPRLFSLLLWPMASSSMIRKNRSVKLWSSLIRKMFRFRFRFLGGWLGAKETCMRRIKGEIDPYLRQPKQAPICNDPLVKNTGGSIDLSSDGGKLKTPGLSSSSCQFLRLQSRKLGDIRVSRHPIVNNSTYFIV